FRDVKVRIYELQSKHPSEMRKILGPVQECESQIASFSSGITADRRYDVIKHVHRALLTVAHAQSLARNFQGEGRLSGEIGANISNGLNVLEEALTELSAACLNLIPKVELSAPDSTQPNIREVTISISNQGLQTITSVKIGATAPKN